MRPSQPAGSASIRTQPRQEKWGNHLGEEMGKALGLWQEGRRFPYRCHRRPPRHAGGSPGKEAQPEVRGGGKLSTSSKKDIPQRASEI